MNTYRTTARIVGVVYLAGFVVGLTGTSLIQSVLGGPNSLATVSAHGLVLTVGAMLWLMAAAGDAAHGVLMFPILGRRSERIAVGYLAARIVDAVFGTVYVLLALIQLPLGSEYLKAAAPTASSLQALSTVLTQTNVYALDLAFIFLGLAGLMLNYLFYRAGLLPRWIAVWGLVGYAIIVCGTVSAVMGSGLGLASQLPGGLWEVFVGVWLIARGFNRSAFVPDTTSTSAPGEPVPASS